MKKQTWWLEPRDPLVLGDGGQLLAYNAGKSPTMPPQSALAGTVRTSLAKSIPPTPNEALELLKDIAIRGPWLWGEVPTPDGKTKNQHLFPPPADLREFESESDGKVLHFPGKLIRLPKGTGIYRPEPSNHFQPEIWCDIQEKVTLEEDKKTSKNLVKTHPARGYLSLEDLVGLGLGKSIKPKQRFEAGLCHSRTHVKIDSKLGTADHGALFTTNGLELAQGLGIGVEIKVLDKERTPPNHVVLGGESRLSFRRDEPAAALPAFDVYKSKYQKTAAEIISQNHVIRLQLLTPAFLPNETAPPYLPSWYENGNHPDLEGYRLKLAGICMPAGHLSINGWNLMAKGNDSQKGTSGGAPRKFRRLVPAGSIYYFRLEKVSGEIGPDDLVTVCEKLWFGNLDPANPLAGFDADNYLAAAKNDGYGLVLPGIQTFEEK